MGFVWHGRRWVKVNFVSVDGLFCTVGVKISAQEVMVFLVMKEIAYFYRVCT